jgi:hypothetical protein
MSQKAKPCTIFPPQVSELYAPLNYVVGETDKEAGTPSLMPHLERIHFQVGQVSDGLVSNMKPSWLMEVNLE